jgi:TRAP-type transport system small permease protein
VNRHPADPALTAQAAMTRLFLVLGILSFAVVFICTIVATVTRYFSVPGFEWAYEVAGIAFIWLTFLGAVVAELKGENVAFDVLKKKAAPRWRAVFEILAAASLAVVGGSLLLSAIAMLELGGWVPTPLLRWPTGVTTAAIVAFGGAVCLLTAFRIKEQVKSTVPSH